MNPLLTDDAVSRLPLEGARAELLEALLAESAPARRTPPRWVVPLAAAAVVAGIAASSLAWAQLRDEPSSPPVAGDSGGLGRHVVLDAPGWRVDHLGADGMSFVKGRASLEITSYDAASYDSYVEDREHIPEVPAPGAPITVLGRPAQMWAYSADDHTAIREVEDGRWLELRGSGLDQASYLALLGQLRFASQAAFEASLPDGTVTSGERQAAADRILADIEAVSGAGFPRDEAPSFAEGAAEDRYQFGVEVAGGYACAWLAEYETAQSHQQRGPARAALRVLGTAHDWPILTEMDAEGDYPDLLWQIADEAQAGDLQSWYREGLGC
jgi:hypothetical protein